jgi:DNA-binding transcriptional LysR family regulator
MGLSSVDLNLLVALDALLSEQHVTRAAERTGVGQAAMSASLARLRKHFGDPLLIREGRRLVPTARAESLVQPVRGAIAAAEGALGVGRAFDPRTDHRTFTILASDYVTLLLLRPLLAQLATEAPCVRFNVVPVEPDYIEKLRQGRVDLLIIPTALVGQRFLFPHRVLFEDRFVLAADRDNPDVGETVTAEEFARLPALAYGGGQLNSLVESQLDALGIDRRVEVTTQNFVISPFLLTGTRLVSVLHERLARHVEAQARLRILEPPVPLQAIVEAMYWNPRDTDAPAHRWLRERIEWLAERL